MLRDRCAINLVLGLAGSVALVFAAYMASDIRDEEEGYSGLEVDNHIFVVFLGEVVDNDLNVPEPSLVDPEEFESLNNLVFEEFGLTEDFYADQVLEDEPDFVMVNVPREAEENITEEQFRAVNARVVYPPRPLFVDDTHVGVFGGIGFTSDH